ncbi:MAG: hypothetical protein NXI31_06470 [bacterium]|nr:hypothetical protein [bacterium]
MNQQSFGDISLEEYQRILEGGDPAAAGPVAGGEPPRRASWLRRAGLVAGCLMAALFCSAVGDYLGPWSGKSSSDLSYEQAFQIVQQQGPERWVTELGIVGLFKHVRAAMLEMSSAALANSADAEQQVGAALSQIAHKAITLLVELGEVGEFPEQHRGQLDTLRQKLDK